VCRDRGVDVIFDELLDLASHLLLIISLTYGLVGACVPGLVSPDDWLTSLGAFPIEMLNDVVDVSNRLV